MDHDEQLLAIGKQCSHPTCLLVDFLPFKCQHCSEAFCQEHFLVKDHDCPKYDETKHNRIAPHCMYPFSLPDRVLMSHRPSMQRTRRYTSRTRP